jgi:uncharacterized phage-associated protein
MESTIEDGQGNFTTAAAANAFLRSLEDHGLSADPMKLQKLLYFAHGYYLAVTDNPWIDEAFEAWDYGPVVPSVYYELKGFGGDEIGKGFALSELVADGREYRFRTANSATEDDNTGAQIVSFVVDKYGKKDGIYLSNLTHKVGTPWHEIKMQNNGRIPRNTDIPNDLIKAYFRKLIGLK